MKKKIYLQYSSVYNMGDMLNKDMLEELFDIEILHSNKYHTDMIGIGSGLSSALISDNESIFSKEYLFRKLKRGPFYVWGTGFMNYTQKPDNRFKYKDIRILSLRGELSKKRVEAILDEKLNIPLGDGGLLAEKWVGKVEKRYNIGIIPHFREQDAPIINQLLSSFKDSVLINLKDDAKTVCKKIAECECILSSSLHGLIVSDSFHIPNLHVLFYDYGEKMLGDGYKFSDYYSSYNLDDKPIFIDGKKSFPSEKQIRENYRISSEEVEKKKEAIYKAFLQIL